MLISFGLKKNYFDYFYKADNRQVFPLALRVSGLANTRSISVGLHYK